MAFDSFECAELSHNYCKKLQKKKNCPFSKESASFIEDAKNIYLCDLHATIKNECEIQVLDSVTDYGRPMKPFFIEIQNFWAWADNLGR